MLVQYHGYITVIKNILNNTVYTTAQILAI